jgi:predicted nucleic acid-binding protein
MDTNIVIYYLDNQIPSNHLEQVRHIFRTSFQISTITKIEILGWNRLTEAEKERLEGFLSAAQVFYIGEAIEQKAIELKQAKRIATPDAVIAATALVYNLTIVTRNEKDMEKVEGLRIYNPFK